MMILKHFMLIILCKCHSIGPIGAPSWTSHISMASLCSTLHSWSFTKEHYIELALFIIHKFTSLNGCMWHYIIPNVGPFEVKGEATMVPLLSITLWNFTYICFYVKFMCKLLCKLLCIILNNFKNFLFF